MTSTIDDTIQTVESLYEALTGCEAPAPDGTYAPVPPEADPLAHIEAQVARLANLIVRPEPLVTPTWSPPIVVWEDDKDLVIEIEVAGLGKNDVEVSVIRQLVTITGNRRPTSADNLIWANERRFGPFLRTISLPDQFDSKSVRYSFHRGVLQLRFSNGNDTAGDSKTVDRN